MSLNCTNYGRVIPDSDSSIPTTDPQKRDANQFIFGMLPEIIRDIRRFNRLKDFWAITKWVCNHDGDHCLRLDFRDVMKHLRDYEEEDALALIEFMRDKNIIQSIYDPQRPNLVKTDRGTYTFSLDCYRSLKSRLSQLLPPQL